MAADTAGEERRFLAGLTGEQLRNRVEGYTNGPATNPGKAAAAQAELDRRAAAAPTPPAESFGEDDGRCPRCKHEAEHLFAAGCVARTGGTRCGCRRQATDYPR